MTQKLPQVKPLSNKVFIKLEEAPDEIVTDSGIVIPDFDGVRKASTQIATVIETNDGYYTPQGNFIESKVKPGDKIIVNHHAVFQVELNPFDKRTYIAEHEIIAIIKD